MKRSKTNEMSAGRRTANVFSLLVTCAVLFFTVEMSSGGEVTTGIYKMTTDINRALMQVLAGIGEFNYTEHTPRTDYNSSTAFNNKGMALLYNATGIFMKALLPNPTPNGLVIVEKDQTIKIKDNDYGALVKHYIIYIIFISILALFALLMPICGFCFCCCRCCGNCGGRSKPFDKKGDLCKKFIYATLLIALGTLFLFGVVCAFVSNQNMQDGTESLASNLRTSSNDASAFLEDTNKHVEILLQKNFKEFQTVIMDALNKSSDILYDELKEISKAASMEDAQRIVEYMEPVREELMQIKNLINKLRVEASQLNDATRKIKRDLLATINDCKGRQECDKLMQDYISKLGTDIDFNSIPDVSKYITELDGIVSLGLTEKVKEGIAVLEGIKTNINNKVRGNIVNVGNEIDRAGETIRKESNSVLKLLNDANKSLKDASKKYLDETDKYVREYSQYRYYVGLGVSCVLLLITLCIALGLICGVCGKRPGSYNDDCCNKGAGSKFLIFGVALMFLFACIFVIVLLIHSVGIFVHFLVCEPVRHPENNAALEYVESLIDTKKLLGSDMKISSVLTNCYKNKSAYEVFNLKSRFDLSKVQNYTKEFNIEHFLKEIEKEIDKVNIHDVVLLDDPTLEKIKAMKNAELSNINFKKIVEELSINFTTVDLTEISQQLEKYILSLPTSQVELITSLKNIKIHIDAYIEKLFIPMTENANNVKTLAIKIEKDLRFGKNSFEEAITDLVKNIKEAEQNLKLHGHAELKNITKKFSYAILDHTQSYLDRVVARFEDDVGECGPLALVINGTMTSTCDKILLPMNGFWFSILWCLILFVPSIIISVKLASLYQKYDPYPGSFVESEYLYDAYADRENIPLARGKHGKKKHKKKRSDGRYVTYEPGHREPGGSYHPDARYADMAPKHFEDYPNGGPPQYQRATEYERPPPYYYPGTGDQN